MPLPAAALIALGSELLNLVPWVRKNPAEAEKIVPKLVDVARSIVPNANEQAAVEQVKSDPVTQKAFVQEVAVKWADIEPALRFEEESRDRAAVRAKTDDKINDATGLLIYGALGAVAVVFVSLVAMLVLQTLYMPDHRPMGELIALFITICGILIGYGSAIYQYRFGSSAGSKASGDAVRAIAERR